MRVYILGSTITDDEIDRTWGVKFLSLCNSKFDTNGTDIILYRLTYLQGHEVKGHIGVRL